MKLTKLVKIAESLNKKARYKKPNYPSHINEENTKELEAAGAANAGEKAIRMTARQLGTTEAAVRTARTKERKRQKEIADAELFSGDVKLKPKKQPRISSRETLPSEEELDKRLGYSKKGEGFAGYENDQDPETHVKIQAKDHARTGSAQQAQYDGTEGKSESKEKPLKVLTDGELEEVEKLKALALETKDALKPVEGQGKMKPQSGRKPDGREKPDYFESQRPYGFGKLGRKEPQTSRGQADDATQSTVSPHGGYSAKDPRDGSRSIIQLPPREAGEDTTAGDKKLNQHKPVATGHASSGNSWRKEEKIPLSMYDHEPATEIKEEDFNKEGKYTHHKLRKVPRTGEPAKDLKHEPLGEAAENRLSDSARMERAAFGIPQSDETYDQEEERRRGGKQPKTGKAPKDIKASKLGKIRKKAMELLKSEDEEKKRKLLDEKLGRLWEEIGRYANQDKDKKMKSAELLKRDDWDKEEKRERKYEEFPTDDEPLSPNDDIPDDAKRKIQTDMRSEVRGKKVPKDIKQEGVDLDEKIGEELGEVPRSRVQGEREGRRTVSDQGKHVGNKFIDDASRYYARRQAATDEKPSDDEIKDVATNAQTIGHALTYEKEEAEKWKSFIKAVNTVNKRRGRGRRTLPKVIEKEGTNAANGTSPRGANFLGTNDTEAFNVRHNGGRNTKRIGKKPEDLGNFP